MERGIDRGTIYFKKSSNRSTKKKGIIIIGGGITEVVEDMEMTSEVLSKGSSLTMASTMGIITGTTQKKAINSSKFPGHKDIKV